MVMSLIYSSHCRLPDDAHQLEDGMEAIRLVAARQNHQFDITGFMFFFDRKFVQIIEGDFDNVANLYKCIRRDTRHDSCRIVEFCEVPQRFFGPRMLAHSIAFIRDNAAELQVKMRFLNRFIGESGRDSIKIRDLLVSIASELQKKSHFPRDDLSSRLGLEAPLRDVATGHA